MNGYDADMVMGEHSMADMPTVNDEERAQLVYRAIASVRALGRFGDRKVFIAPLWDAVIRLDAASGRGLTLDCTIEHFKAWLLRARRLRWGGCGDRLIVLARADLVAAMDPRMVAASEMYDEGATYHFILDPTVAHDAYAVPKPRGSAVVPKVTGRIGMRCSAAR